MFLCPWDVEEGEFEDEGGIPAAAIRLDETVQIPGEILSYVYDYGDNYVEGLQAVKPKAFLMENVYGLAYQNQNRPILNRFVGSVRAAGYSFDSRIISLPITAFLRCASD